MGVKVRPAMPKVFSASMVEKRSVGLLFRRQLREVGPELVVEHVGLQALDDRRSPIGDDGLVELAEDVVEKERKTAVVIEMGVRHDHVADPELLFESERPGEAAGIESHGIVQEKAGEKTVLDAPAGTAHHSKSHDAGSKLPGDSTSHTGWAAIRDVRFVILLRLGGS